MVEADKQNQAEKNAYLKIEKAIQVFDSKFQLFIFQI